MEESVMPIILFQCVLHYMVGSKGGVSGVTKDVIDILTHARLMKT